MNEELNLSERNSIVIKKMLAPNKDPGNQQESLRKMWTNERHHKAPALHPNHERRSGTRTVTCWSDEPSEKEEAPSEGESHQMNPLRRVEKRNSTSQGKQQGNASLSDGRTLVEHIIKKKTSQRSGEPFEREPSATKHKPEFRTSRSLLKSTSTKNTSKNTSHVNQEDDFQTCDGDDKPRTHSSRVSTKTMAANLHTTIESMTHELATETAQDIWDYCPANDDFETWKDWWTSDEPKAFLKEMAINGIVIEPNNPEHNRFHKWQEAEEIFADSSFEDNKLEDLLALNEWTVDDFLEDFKRFQNTKTKLFGAV